MLEQVHVKMNFRVLADFLQKAVGYSKPKSHLKAAAIQIYSIQGRFDDQSMARKCQL